MTNSRLRLSLLFGVLSLPILLACSAEPVPPQPSPLATAEESQPSPRDSAEESQTAGQHESLIKTLEDYLALESRVRPPLGQQAFRKIEPLFQVQDAVSSLGRLVHTAAKLMHFVPQRLQFRVRRTLCFGLDRFDDDTDDGKAEDDARQHAGKWYEKIWVHVVKGKVI